VPLGPRRRSSRRPRGPSRPLRSRHRACSPKPRRLRPRQHRPRAFPAPGQPPLARRLRDLPTRRRLVPVRPGQLRATMPLVPRPHWPAVQGADPARTSPLRERAQWLRVQRLMVRSAVDLAQVPLRLVVHRAARLRRPREPVRLVRLVVQLAGPMPSAQVHEPVRLGPPWALLRLPPARRPARPDRDRNRPSRRPERSRPAVRTRRGDRISPTSEQRRLQATRCGSTSPGQPATGRFPRRLPSRRLLLPRLRRPSLLRPHRLRLRSARDPLQPRIPGSHPVLPTPAHPTPALPKPARPVPLEPQQVRRQLARPESARPESVQRQPVQRQPVQRQPVQRQPVQRQPALARIRWARGAPPGVRRGAGFRRVVVVRPVPVPALPGERSPLRTVRPSQPRRRTRRGCRCELCLVLGGTTRKTAS
jgi:hypothetical protein